MNIEARFQLWLQVRKFLGIGLFVVLFMAFHWVATQFAVEGAVARFIDAISCIVAIVVKFVSLERLENYLFDGQIETEPTSPAFKVIVTVLALVGVLLFTVFRP